MLEQEIVQQGTNLMAFGMGTVFVFLSLLILCTSLMSSFINRFFPEPQTDLLPPAKSTPTNNDEINPQVLGAIQLAIKEHRAKQ